MARVTVPIRVNGVEIMLNVLNDFSMEWDPDVPKDYQRGFTDCLEIVKKAIAALDTGDTP